MLWDGEGCTVALHHDRDATGPWFYVDLDGECFESGTNPDDARRIIGQVCDIVTAWGDSIDKGATIAAALDILAPWFAEREAPTAVCTFCGQEPVHRESSNTCYVCLPGKLEAMKAAGLQRIYDNRYRNRRDTALAPMARALGDPHGPIHGLDRVDCKWCGRPSMIDSEYCSDECGRQQSMSSSGGSSISTDTVRVWAAWGQGEEI